MGHVAQDLEELLTTKQVAAKLRVSTSFLAKLRMDGGGPKYRKLGRAVVR